MGAHSGPNYDTDGIILLLDPSNPNCFTNGATECINLITGGSVTGPSGTPGTGVNTDAPNMFPAYSSLNGGVFNFAGGKGMNCNEDLGYRTTTSLSIWFYKTSSAVEYLTDARNDGGQWFLSNYISYNLVYQGALGYNYDATYNASSSGLLNNWQHLVVTSDNSGSKLYLNGFEVSNYGVQSSLDEDFGVNFRIGTRYTTANHWSGFMGVISAFDRVLSAEEVLQNYVAHKGRYGL